MHSSQLLVVEREVTLQNSRHTYHTYSWITVAWFTSLPLDELGSPQFSVSFSSFFSKTPTAAAIHSRCSPAATDEAQQAGPTFPQQRKRHYGTTMIVKCSYLYCPESLRVHTTICHPSPQLVLYGADRSPRNTAGSRSVIASASLLLVGRCCGNKLPHTPVRGTHNRVGVFPPKMESGCLQQTLL